VTGFIPYEEAGGVGPGAVLIAVAFLSLVPGCARSSANPPGGAVTTPREHSIQIDPADQECTQDTECILIQTHCGGCSCGTPINRAAEAKVRSIAPSERSGAVSERASSSSQGVLTERCEGSDEEAIR